MQLIYESQDEQALHDGAIDALADEMRLGAHEIRPVYESCYLRLRRAARIRDYLPVLVARHTREALRQRTI
jgi:hypothetical protein